MSLSQRSLRLLLDGKAKLGPNCPAPVSPAFFWSDDGTLQDHFVFGSNKQGSLWSILGPMALHTEKGVRLVCDVTFHRPSQHAHIPQLGGTIVHGGASAAIIDSVAAWAGVLALGGPALTQAMASGGHDAKEDVACATANQAFKYKGPMMVDRQYTLIAHSDAEGMVPGKSSSVRCAYVDDEGRELVVSDTTIKVLPAKPRSPEIDPDSKL